MQQYSTFYTLMQKSVVVLLRSESPDATVQHFLHVDVEKCCGVASKMSPWMQHYSTFYTLVRQGDVLMFQNEFQIELARALVTFWHLRHHRVAKNN